MINFHHIDCIEFIKGKPDKFYDLAVVDPPYGIGMSNTEQIGTSKKHKVKDWDKSIPDLHYFNELKRVSRHQIIWGVNYFNEMGLSGGRIVWNKLGKNIGRRAIAPTFSECELAYYSGANNIKMFSYTYIGNVQGNDYQILWSETNRIHPTQKPIELYRWLLQNYAKQGDKILDTHGGSMSSAIACDMEGFDLDICELDKEYFDNGVKRFNNYKSQLTLF